MLLDAYYEARTIGRVVMGQPQPDASPGTGRLMVACEGMAMLFMTLTVLATQDQAIRAASPWQDDPYDAMVSLAQFTVPMLAVVIGLRLLAWRAPGAPDREHQTTRASVAMLALIALTLGFEWASVVARAHAPAWNVSTVGLIGGLLVMSVCASVISVLLWRRRRPRGASRHWRTDWLGDVVWLAGRIPVLRRWVRPEAAQRVRQHALTVFVGLSMVGAAGVVGALAVGEQWADPGLIAWAFIVVATAYFAFCVISNNVAGFITRPHLSRPRRIAQTSVLAGCVAIQLVTAFRDPVWAFVATGPVSSVTVLAALTLGAGLTVGAASAILLLTRPDRTARQVPPP